MCRKHIIKSNWRTGLVSNAIRVKANGMLLRTRNMGILKTLRKAIKKVRQ